MQSKSVTGQIDLELIGPEEVDRINHHHRMAFQSFLEHVREVGRLLVEVKAQLPHGAFQEWVDRHCCFSYRTAAAYMRITTKWGEIEGSLATDMQSPATLTLDRVLKLISSPRRVSADTPADFPGKTPIRESSVADSVSTTTRPMPSGRLPEGTYTSNAEPAGTPAVPQATTSASEDVPNDANIAGKIPAEPTRDTVTFYTIGYGNRKPLEFGESLAAHGIRLVVDVRLRPDRAGMGYFSKNKSPDKGIEKLLQNHGIAYRSFIELGNLFIDCDDWSDRYRNLLEQAGELLTARLVGLPEPFCLLCSEQRVEECHRGILANYLVNAKGWESKHLR